MIDVMRKISVRVSALLIALFIILSVSTTPVSADEIETAGDILQIAIPTAAYAATFYLDDTEGRNQFYKSFLTTLGTTYTLKYTIDKERPDGGNHSFPSGHTAAAFAGASFTQMRYGWKWGVPSYLLASFVGYSRVDADKHYPIDVAAGASLAIASSWYFVEKFENAPMIGIFSDGETSLVSLTGSW